MNRQPRARIMKAKALTSPEPEFVSQVRAGANQEPIRAVKMDTGISEIVALFEEKELDMKDAVKKAKEAGHDIAQLVFKGGSFPDRASVDAWLKDGGFEENSYEVSERKDGEATEFTAASTVTKFKTGTMKKIKGQADGLTVFVGEVEGEVVVEKSAEEIAAAEAAIKASAITSAKGDAVEANATTGTEEQETEEAKAAKAAAATAEVVPTETAPVEVAPAATVAEHAALVVKADAVLTELRAKTATIYDVSSLGSVINTLRWMVNDATYEEIPDATVQKLKSAANTLLDVLVDYANQAIGVLAEAFKADKAPTEPVTTVKSDEAPAPVAVEPVAVVTAVPEGLEAVLKSIGTAIETLTSVVKTQGEDIAEVKAKGALAAEEASNKGQTRKGADVTPVATSGETETKKKADAVQAHASRRLRSALGSIHGNGFID
jgi:hypothetical protein